MKKTALSLFAIFAFAGAANAADVAVKPSAPEKTPVAKTAAQWAAEGRVLAPDAKGFRLHTDAGTSEKLFKEDQTVAAAKTAK